MAEYDVTPHSQLEKAAPFGRSYLLGGITSIFLAFETLPKLNYISGLHLILLIIWLVPWFRKGSLPCHIRLTLMSTWAQLIVSLLLISATHQNMMESHVTEGSDNEYTTSYYILGFFLMSTVILLPWVFCLIRGYKLVLLGHRIYARQR